MFEFIKSQWGAFEWIWKGLVLAVGAFLIFLVPRGEPGVKTDWAARLAGSDRAYLLILALGFFLIRLPFVFYLQCNIDSSGWIVGAETLLRDPRFWISVDGQSSGPVVLFTPLLIRLVGAPINYWSTHVLVVFIWIAVFSLLFLSIRTRCDSRSARIAILPLVMAIGMNVDFDFIAYNGKLMPTLLFSVALFLHARWEARGRPQLQGVWIGLALGLIPLAKPQGVPIGLAMAFMICAPLIRARDKGVVPVIIGGLLPTVLLGLYLVASGAYFDFWQSYIITLLFYVETGNVWPRYFFVIASDLGGWVKNMPFLAFVFLWAITGGAGFAWLMLRWKKLAPERRWLVVMSLVIALSAIWGVLQPGRPFSHYFILLAVPAVFLLGIQLGYLRNQVKRPGILEAGFLLLTVIVPAGITFANLGEETKIFRKSFLEASFREPHGRGRSAVSQEILKHAKPGDRMAVWGWASQLYVQTGLIQGTRDPIAAWQLTPGSQQMYYLERYASDLRRLRPRIFLDAVTEAPGAFVYTDKNIHGFERFPLIRDLVHLHYDLVADIDGFRIYVKKGG